MVRKFCYRQRGRDFGPFTAEEMRTEAADGRIESDAIVWEYGTSTGVYAKDVVGLFASNGSKSPKDAHSQPPPLPQVSDECIFRYVEFVFYKELRAIEEDRHLGVFTREEARERERSLLAALQRIGEQLGQNTSHLPATDPAPFFGQIEGKYHDPRAARRAADDAAACPSETPLDAALLGVLAGSAAAMLLPWGDEAPRSSASDHDTVIEEEVVAVPKAKAEEPKPEPQEVESRPEIEEDPPPSKSAGIDPNEEEAANIDPDQEEADDDFGESFDGISENWD